MMQRGKVWPNAYAPSRAKMEVPPGRRSGRVLQLRKCVSPMKGRVGCGRGGPWEFGEVAKTRPEAAVIAMAVQYQHEAMDQGQGPMGGSNKVFSCVQVAPWRRAAKAKAKASLNIYRGGPPRGSNSGCLVKSQRCMTTTLS